MSILQVLLFTLFMGHLLAVKHDEPLYEMLVARGRIFFTEAFESDKQFRERWVLSEAKKNSADAVVKYDGVWSVEEPEEDPLTNDLGLVLKSSAKHHAVAAMLESPFEFDGKPLVVQYEVKFQHDINCGGAYMKLLSQDANMDLSQFNDQTPYTIMFGPDTCGSEYKLHFIFRHKNPVTGLSQEKHAHKPQVNLESHFNDKKTHLYTLVIFPDNKFEVHVDRQLINSGNLLLDVSPAVNPPKEVIDPNDVKPADWDEREKIEDPSIAKPDDWDESEPEMIEDWSKEKPKRWLDDEPELIQDDTAVKPADWDDDIDGEWEAPLIDNPKCKFASGCGTWKRPLLKNPNYRGKWIAPEIDNPNFKGIWTPRTIVNPDYFEDLQPYKMIPISAIGLELWSMSDGILFDNFIVTDNKTVADLWSANSWELKHQVESVPKIGFIQSIINATNERPWLWAVLIVVVILPIVLIITYCCVSYGKEDETATHKKTDNIAPDDDEVENTVEDIDVELESEEGSNWLNDGEEVIAEVIETVVDSSSDNNQEIFTNSHSSDAVLETCVKKKQNQSEQEGKLGDSGGDH